MKKIFQNTLLLFVGLAVGLVLAEMVSHFFLPPAAIQKLPYLHMEADPFCGYKYVPNQKGYTLSSAVKVNKWGFRGPDWSKDKPQGVIRIALLGDSYIFGQGVGDQETAASQLENMLNGEAPSGKRYEVLNFGMSGYDQGHEIESLKHYALSFKPDMVFLCFFINDLFYIKDYGFYSEMLRIDESKFSIAEWNWRNLLRRCRLGMFLWDWLRSKNAVKYEVQEAIDAYVGRDILPPNGIKADGWKFALDRVRDFKVLSEREKFKPFFIVVPTPEEIQNNRKSVYENYLLNESTKLGVESPDIFPVFKDVFPKSKLLIPYNYHLSGDGNRLLADALRKEIRKAR